MYRKAPLFLKNKKVSICFVQADTYLETIKANALCVEGRLFFKELRVDEKLFISGEMVGKDLKCKAFEAHGMFSVKKVKAETGVVNGKMYMVEGHIDHLELTTLKSTLEQSTVGTIVVKPCHSGIIPPLKVVKENQEDWVPTQVIAPRLCLEPKKQQILFLKTGSRVDNIIFESGDGIVYVDSTSKVMGKVIGGRVLLAHSLLPASILFSQYPSVKSADKVLSILSSQSTALKRTQKRVLFAT